MYSYPERLSADVHQWNARVSGDRFEEVVALTHAGLRAHATPYIELYHGLVFKGDEIIPGIQDTLGETLPILVGRLMTGEVNHRTNQMEAAEISPRLVLFAAKTVVRDTTTVRLTAVAAPDKLSPPPWHDRQRNCG